MLNGFGYSIAEWNHKIYRDADGAFAGEIGAEELWNEFKIKSAPKFNDSCWSNIPYKWGEDVREFLTKVQNELGDRVEFTQIKERFCFLTVYVSCSDDEAMERLRVLEKECVNNLIKKGVHPPKQEKDNG